MVGGGIQWGGGGGGDDIVDSGAVSGSLAPAMDEHGGCHAARWWRRMVCGEEILGSVVADTF
jgi:hypothetical protein